MRGIGDNTLSLVERAIELGSHDEDGYNQIWCVFDRDSFPPERFNAALDLARRQGVKVAYSNQSFELWYLLHFHYFNTGMTRSDYCNRLGELLGHRYEKNDESMYRDLECRQEDAIRNARRLLEQYCPLNPERDDPSTTVHQLVEQLRRFAV